MGSEKGTDLAEQVCDVGVQTRTADGQRLEVRRVASSRDALQERSVSKGFHEPTREEQDAGGTSARARLEMKSGYTHGG
jgi:hypothetical protein